MEANNAMSVQLNEFDCHDHEAYVDLEEPISAKLLKKLEVSKYL